MPVELPPIEPRARKIAAVWCIGPGLRLQTQCVGLSIEAIAPSRRAAVEKITRIELQAGLVGEQFERASRARRLEPRGQPNALAARKTEIMIVAAPAAQLLVVHPDARANGGAVPEVERRTVDSARRPLQGNRGGIDGEEVIGGDPEPMSQDVACR